MLAINHTTNKLISQSVYIPIHSGYFYGASSSPLLLRGAPDYSTDTVLEFHAEAPQAIASEGLAQGPYTETRAGFKPATLQTKGDESTNEPLCSTLTSWVMDLK